MTQNTNKNSLPGVLYKYGWLTSKNAVILQYMLSAIYDA